VRPDCSPCIRQEDASVSATLRPPRAARLRFHPNAAIRPNPDIAAHGDGLASSKLVRRAIIFPHQAIGPRSPRCLKDGNNWIPQDQPLGPCCDLGSVPRQAGHRKFAKGEISQISVSALAFAQS
jgi:hypothetical protein